MSNQPQGSNSSSQNPLAADAVVTKLSPWSPADTVARLSDLIKAKGMKLFAVIDHSGEAEAVGSSCATRR